MKTIRIGVMIAGDDAELQGKIIKSLEIEADKKGIDLLFFHSLMNRPDFGSHKQVAKEVLDGEERIYELPSYDMFDGLIMHGESFAAEENCKRVIERAKSAGIPIVNLDSEREDCPCIVFEQDGGMAAMVRHVIEEHGCRRINIISGYQGNWQSECRVQAYRKVLAEYGMEVEERRIGYGHFNEDAIQVIREYMETYQELPEAIVCANDSMAMRVIRYLQTEHYRIPEDVIVTGYDGLEEGQEFYPALTTVSSDIQEAARMALQSICDVIAGKTIPQLQKAPFQIICNQSCGCVKNEIQDITAFYDRKDTSLRMKDRFNYQLIAMMRDLVDAKTVPEVLLTARNYAYFFEEEFYFIINQSIDEQIPPSLDEGLEYEEYGRIYPAVLKQNQIADRSPCKIADLFPKLLQEENLRACFVPMYYKNLTLGYVMLKKELEPNKMAIFYTWLTSITNTIGAICLQSEVKRMMEKLNLMSITDEVTKLYNRCGFHSLGEELVENCKVDGRRMYAVELDLDRLKMINDVYGHSAGDHAIIMVAEAMRAAAFDDTMAFRTGGDEFYLLGSCEHEEFAEQQIAAVRQFLSVYNERKEVPYRVEVSCGGAVVSPDQAISLEQLMNLVDAKMYENKAIRKQLRNANEPKDDRI